MCLSTTTVQHDIPKACDDNNDNDHNHNDYDNFTTGRNDDENDETFRPSSQLSSLRRLPTTLCLWVPRQLDPKFGSQQAEDGTVPGVTQETQGHFLDLSSMAVNQTSIESDVVLMIGERHNRQQQVLKT